MSEQEYEDDFENCYEEDFEARIPAPYFHSNIMLMLSQSQLVGALLCRVMES